ncbi:DNA polymerase alpha/epsilon subunit B-domain-containing protein [Cytidiella melzeri]|nr:DNA polymerase alpha/epsilon subunit B-domain-containing protein [Cytidiella melzeri]
MNGSQLNTPDAPYTRIPTTVLAPPEGTPSFAIGGLDKSFKHQYANIYFMRLHALRKFVEDKAKRRWGHIDGTYYTSLRWNLAESRTGNPKSVPRVLEIEKGQLSYVIGTVYMDMPLKPNVLDDIARDHSIPAPSPQAKYHSADDDTMLEDESGRIRLVGDCLKSTQLVTGIIIGALGIETNAGDFEVVDICFAGMAPQAVRDHKDPETTMDVDAAQSSSSLGSDEWLAVVSGLDIGAPSYPDGQLQMLAEYLTGESGGLDEQLGASRISRLIIAGNSLATMSTSTEDVDKKSRRYGQEASTFSPHPIRNLSDYLTDIARSMPIHLLPGPSDPTGTLLPQQPLPRAMFGAVASYSSFSCETNPTYLYVSASCTRSEDEHPSPPSTGKPSGSKTTTSTTKPIFNPTATLGSGVAYERSILAHSGQPMDDMFRYLPSPPVSRLSIAEKTLKWRHFAPTAPDTLWCHPFLRHEPFVIQETPDIYIIGNQPVFKTKLVRGEVEEDEDGGGGAAKRCRIILVPKFRESGVVVLVNLRTLQVRTVCAAVQGMTTGSGP